MLLSLCALAATPLFGGVVAQAEVTHEYLSQITEVPATGPHGEPVPVSGGFQFVDSMTIDSGELYVNDFRAGLSRLDKFDISSGAFQQQFAQLPSSYAAASQSVAVGHATGETEVYDLADRRGAGLEGVVAVYSSAGEVQGYWTGADTPAQGFKCFECGNGPGGVAVDNSANPLTRGDVYVSVPEEGVVDVFEPKAGGGERYLRQLTGPEPGVPFNGPEGVTVDQQNGDVLVIDGEGVDVFEPTALEQYVLVRRLTGAPRRPFQRAPSGVVVDSGNGEIFIMENVGTEPAIYEFDSEGAYLGRLTGTPAGPFDQLRGLAVDPATGDAGEVYVGTGNVNAAGEQFGFVQIFGPDIVIPDVTTEPVSSVTYANATLNGTVNPDKAGEATCRFEWGTTTEFGKVAPCEPEGVAEGGTPVPVHAAISGLAPDTTYHYRLQATNKADGHTNPGEPSQDQEFITPGPGIHDESTTNVAATSATLDASIDPNNAPTTYYFQYGTSTAYGTDVPMAPGASIGSGKGDEEVARHLQGLLPGTTYHYRVVAVSELKPGEIDVFEGADQTFLTQPPGSPFALLDNRQWEMVSPPDKFGAEIETDGQDPLQASVNGDAITYSSNTPTEANPPGYAKREQDLVLRGPAGWASRDISPLYDIGSGVSIGQGQEYRFFSEDLSLSVIHPFAGDDSPLSPEASEPTAYLRTDYLNGNVDEPCLPASMSCYRPLVTGKPGYANVPPGTAFGEEKPGEERECIGARTLCGPEIVGASPDLRHIVLLSEVPLMPGGGDLYEWNGGRLTNIGTGRSEDSSIAQWVISPQHGVSDDGSRVVFEAERQGGLFMRDVATGELVQLDAVQGGTGDGQSEATIQGAASDGSTVIFTDTKQLTADSRQQVGETNLYKCEMIEETGKLVCKLSDLTPAGPGEAMVLGAALGVSEDGSYVYFVANGVLAAGAVHGGCARSGPSAGTCNLYVYHDGVTKLVAILSGEDYPDWIQALSSQTTRVSPNGQWLAFMSQQNLTGYVTRDAVTGKPDEEVYLYDAATANLVCASCNPTGARPVGVGGHPPHPNLEEARIIDSNMWSGGVAANIPGWNTYTGGLANYQSRYLSDSGRLFFNSSDALVPQDVNGTEDVYEYEPPGVGSCSTDSATYSSRSQGCIDMISSGTSGEESAFFDASGSGGDVFFITAAKLAPQDYDTAMDVYDARECSAVSSCYPVPVSVPPPCDTGDACKPSPTPQPAIFGSPSSATFSGAGNIVPSTSEAAVEPKGLTRAQKLARALKACRGKRQGKRRAKCERRARARYAAAAKASRANKASKRGGRG